MHKNFSIVLIILQKIAITLFSIINWLEKNMLQCPSKKYLHIECMGCGLQRSFIFLLKGNLFESIKIYPATIPLLIVVLFACLHIVFKLKNGAKIIQVLFIITAAIIFIFYGYKIILYKIY